MRPSPLSVVGVMTAAVAAHAMLAAAAPLPMLVMHVTDVHFDLNYTVRRSGCTESCMGFMFIWSQVGAPNNCALENVGYGCCQTQQVRPLWSARASGPAARPCLAARNTLLRMLCATVRCFPQESVEPYEPAGPWGDYNCDSPRQVRCC